MKTTVIHHSADYDGIFCREIARKFLPDAELVGWDFSDDPISIERVAKSDALYILDLPVDRPFGIRMEELISDASAKGCRIGNCENIIWIDHHKSSIDTHPTNIPGYRIDGVAACRLAWQWFNEPHVNGRDEVTAITKQDFIDRKVSEPWAVRLAGEYDIWDKRDPDAELFQHGLRSQELTAQTWRDLFQGASQTVKRLLKQGEVLQFARANEYRDVITQQGFTLKFEGLTFLACNSHELDIRSHLFEAGIKPEHDALLGFTTNGRDWRVSMYRVPGKDLDILSIAKKYGGGGHVGACGFRGEKLPFIPSLAAS